MKNTISQKAMVLAHQLKGHNASLSFSEALRYAWDIVKKEAVKIVTFLKGGKTPTTRIVSDNLTGFVSGNSNGRSLKPGQVLFVDVAKRESGIAPIISTYKDWLVAA